MSILLPLILTLQATVLVLKDINKEEIRNYQHLIPNVINENEIRILETKYHNLQSKYDTYIANTDIEDIDKDLKMIRGHVSIVYHLLEASTSMIHYYERHVMKLSGQTSYYYRPPLTSGEIRGILVDYFLNYAKPVPYFRRKPLPRCNKKICGGGICYSKCP